MYDVLLIDIDFEILAKIVYVPLTIVLCFIGEPTVFLQANG